MPYMSLFLAAKSFVLERDVPDNAGATGGLAQGDSRPVKRDADADAAEGSGNSAGSGVTNLDDGMSAARFYVPSLPGLPADSALTLYAGHIPSNPVVDGVLDTTSDAHLFFLLVKNRHIADADRTVIWFNGGALICDVRHERRADMESFRTWVLVIRWQLDGGRPVSACTERRRPAQGD